MRKDKQRQSILNAIAGWYEKKKKPAYPKDRVINKHPKFYKLFERKEKTK